MLTTRLLIAICCSIIASSCAFAQLDVYKTFDDLVNKSPKAYPKAKFKKWSGKENTTLVFKDEGHDDIEIACVEIWGFAYNGGLFRITKDSKYFARKGATQVGTPFVVTHLTDVVLYEYGLNLLDAMKHDRDQSYLQGMCGAMSKDLNSPMAMVPCYPVKWTDNELLNLLNDNPELAELKTWFDSKKREQMALSPGSFSLEWLRVMLKDREDARKAREGGQ
ncbi:MAG: hypothetical protein IPP33_13990 [Flavobacteriales bacterium]|nr:hypothetical protein [Flavobacteriales bacterium]